MKKLDKKKLQLGRETIRALSSDNLIPVNGGGATFTLLCGGGYTLVTHCDVPSWTCSVVGYGNECGSKIGP